MLIGHNAKRESRYNWRPVANRHLIARTYWERLNQKVEWVLEGAVF